MKGYRTLWFNVMVITFALSDYFVSNASLLRGLFENPEVATLVIGAIGAVNVALRMITTTPPGGKE